jgi:PilZ domain
MKRRKILPRYRIAGITVPEKGWRVSEEELRMGDQSSNEQSKASAGVEDNAVILARKAKKYLLNRDLLTRMATRQQEERRRARRYLINTELLEVNGNPGKDSKVIDLGMNGARLELPFSLPFMSQLVLKFSLQQSTKIVRVVGRVIWSKMTWQRGRYEVGVQFYQNYWEIDQLLRLGMR